MAPTSGGESSGEGLRAATFQISPVSTATDVIVPVLLKSLKRTAVELVQLHKLDPGEPMTLFSDFNDIDHTTEGDGVHRHCGAGRRRSAIL